MSKSKAIGAILGALVLTCLPAVATTTSSDEHEVLIRLAGADQIGPHHYSVSAGDVVALEVVAQPGDLMFIFAVAIDQWGEPDYGNILTLFLGTPRNGSFIQMFEIPAILEGHIFQVMAVTQDSKGEFHSSNQLSIAVEGLQILVPGAGAGTEPAPLPARPSLSRPVAFPLD
jgi:hypothetical protein